MAKRNIGYGSPPEGRPFKPGQSGNPRGRPPRAASKFGDIVQGVLDGPMEYRKNGRALKAPRGEVSIEVWVEKALNGDIDAAGLILKKRAHALKHGEKAARQVLVVNWLPDFKGQTAEQKTKHQKKGAESQAQGAGNNGYGDNDQNLIDGGKPSQSEDS